MANVELPQLGESVEEGVITAWLVEVGDTVEVDQPLVEISTDKVDTEIPSPVAGTVQELTAEVDDEIQVGQVIAVIGEGDAGGGEAPAAAEEPASSDAGETEQEEAVGAEAAPATPPTTDQPPSRPAQPAAPALPTRPAGRTRRW